MRLINAATLQFESYDDLGRCPQYAILSHRWIHGHEVTFEDMQKPHRQFMPAWPKIRLCCEQALADGLRYVWIDTCCIDKSSSAELSEAINSMYKWYYSADRCYAYLNDVISPNHGEQDNPQEVTEEILELISNSQWFHRAWTLQELIAPKNVIFYDAHFRLLGSKNQLAATIEAVTTIPMALLENSRLLTRYPIATRMSWAANREASRIEDNAYSLFGLFGVNLPLLYGEGSRAFIRLQEEVIRQTHDHSIFVWSAKSLLESKTQNGQAMVKLPLLASSPKDFEAFRDIRVSAGSDGVRPYAMTNLGLQIQLKIHPYDLEVYVGLLNCHSVSAGRYGILLARNAPNSSLWHRTAVKGVDVVTIKPTDGLNHLSWQEMYISRDDAAPYFEDVDEGMLHNGHTPFYGLNLDVPKFLNYSDVGERPYSLVAYYDWTTSTQSDEDNELGQLITDASGFGGQGQIDYGLSDRHDVDNDDEEGLRSFHRRLPGPTASAYARLTPSSHIGLALSIDQTLSTLGFRRIDQTMSRLGFRRIRQTGIRSTADSGLARYEGRSPSPDQARTHESRVSNGITSTGLSIGVLAMPLMSSGTAGMIVFDHPVYGIKSIKAGFDFDYRPVVFLATFEADLDAEIQTQIQQHRYHQLKTFEGHGGMLDRFDRKNHRGFWRLSPEHIRKRQDLQYQDDSSILLEKGVYAFRCEPAETSSHWTFKPYEFRHWHLAIGLEKRQRDGLLYWELTMAKHEDQVKIMIESGD